MKIVIYILLMLLLIITGCKTTAAYNQSQWEGIRGSLLRLYLRTEIPADTDDKNFQSKMDSLILKHAQNRALLILISHIRMQSIKPQYLPNMKQPIISAIEKGEIHDMHCTPVYCEAFFHVDIKKINAIISKTNELAKKIIDSNEKN